PVRHAEGDYYETDRFALFGAGRAWGASGIDDRALATVSGTVGTDEQAFHRRATGRTVTILPGARCPLRKYTARRPPAARLGRRRNGRRQGEVRQGESPGPRPPGPRAAGTRAGPPQPRPRPLPHRPGDGHQPQAGGAPVGERGYHTRAIPASLCPAAGDPGV